MDINYTRLPEHMQGAARRYVEKGIEPGSFLTAVICNDLRGAFGRADEANRAAMWEWVLFFHNDAPGGCWGSPEHFAAWVKQGGLRADRASLEAGA